jgi:hypothetical protein
MPYAFNSNRFHLNVTLIFDRIDLSMLTKIYLLSPTADQITRCGFDIFDLFPVCPRTILVVCGLPPRKKRLEMENSLRPVHYVAARLRSATLE